MIHKLFKAFCLSIGLAAMTQIGHSAAISITESKTVTPIVKTSPIEKALMQQRAEGKGRSDNTLKVLTPINIPPTQSFLAAQNERFSRFIQSLFSSNNS